MRNPRNAHKLRTIVNEVQDSPVTYTNAPEISVAFKLLAARRPRVLTKGFHLAHGPHQHGIGQTFELLPCRRLYLDNVATHEDARAESDLP